MGQGPVIYETVQSLGPCEILTMRWAGAAAIVLKRGAVIRHIPRATLAAFTSGIVLDADLFGASPISAQFAGILADDSIGTVNVGDRISVLKPVHGTVIWCRVAAGLDNGDGVFIQDSATDQGFGDSGAYAAQDPGVNLLDEDASDNPFGDDNLAPILFTFGAVLSTTA